jgi:hypothetical protein
VRNASFVEGTMWKSSLISLQLRKTFLLEFKVKYMKGKIHPLYIYIYIYIYVCVCVCVCVISLTSVLDGDG